MRASAIWLALGLCAASGRVTVPLMELPEAPRGNPESSGFMHADALVELSKSVSADAAIKGRDPDERVGMQIRAVQAAVDSLHGGLERSMETMLKVTTQAEKARVASIHMNEHRRQQEKMYAAEADDANRLKEFSSALLEKLDSAVKVEDTLKSKEDNGMATLAKLSAAEKEEIDVIMTSMTELNGTMIEVNKKFEGQNDLSENITKKANDQVRSLVDLKNRVASLTKQTRDASIVCAELLAFYTYKSANAAPETEKTSSTQRVGADEMSSVLDSAFPSGGTTSLTELKREVDNHPYDSSSFVDPPKFPMWKKWPLFTPDRLAEAYADDQGQVAASLIETASEVKPEGEVSKLLGHFENMTAHPMATLEHLLGL